MKLEGHEDWIRDVSFCTTTMHDESTSSSGDHEQKGDDQSASASDDGDILLASASQDKKIRIWRISESAAKPDVRFANQSRPTALIYATVVFQTMHMLQATKIMNFAHPLTTELTTLVYVKLISILWVFILFQFCSFVALANKMEICDCTPSFGALFRMPCV